MRLIHSPVHRRPAHGRTDRRPFRDHASAAVSTCTGHRIGLCPMWLDDNRLATAPRSTGPARHHCAARRLLLVAEIASLAVVLSVVLPGSAAHADTAHVLALAGTVDDVLNNIRNWIMGVLAGIATVFLTIGGLRYVMAGGDPGEVEKAKTAFKSAALGYGLAALAPLVMTVLKGIVGA